MRPGPYVIKALMGALFMLGLDQASKWWVLLGLELSTGDTVPVLPFFSITLVWNTGISMGLPIEEFTGDLGLILLTGGIVGWLLVWLWRTERLLEAAALTLVVGGAVGNLIDRLVHGAVVDFLHFHSWGYHFYVFNVADAGISVGVGLLLIDSFLGARNAEGEDNRSENNSA